MNDRTLLERILDPGALTVAMQPVFEMHGNAMRLHYLEALIRGPRGTSVESPDILFEYARRKNSTAEVDHACMRAVFAEARALPEEVHIGLNIHASTLA